MRSVASSLSASGAACPQEETLLRFADGDSDAETAAHVGACARCRRALALCLGSTSEGGDDALEGDALVQWVEALQHRRAAALAPGTRLDRYEILRRVGEGGMGAVYAAHDPELDRTVAIKLMHPVRKKSGSPDVAIAGDENRRLSREARALAKVAHPNVVAVYDVGTHEERVFVVMELVEGGTLREWLATRRDAKSVIDVFVEAGRGLVAAHARGLVHRDFKPDNVLVGDDGRVRVTDFGLARVVRAAAEDSRITASKAVVGTPSYMPPEVQQGDPADARSDQFSFAVALYRALAGHPPRPDLPIANEGQAIPRRLRKVLGRALSLDRELRYPSMAAVVDELQACREDPLSPRVALAAVVAIVLGGLVYALVVAPKGANGGSASSVPDTSVPDRAVASERASNDSSSAEAAPAAGLVVAPTAASPTAAPLPSASASAQAPTGSPAIAPPLPPAVPAPKPSSSAAPDPLAEF